MNEGHYPGNELREQRQAMGLATEDVCSQLCIPKLYVEALESGDFSVLPAPCYALAFLQTYCAFLQLPAERYVDSFRACIRSAHKAARRPAPVATSRWGEWREDLLAWTAICAFLLLGWLTYTVVFHPKAEIGQDRVEAGTREMALPPSPVDTTF